MFGTFQEELPYVVPVYGITRPVSTWNPIKINFQHIILLIKDAWRTKSWKDKFLIWIKPTGWRPADVEEKYPLHKIENPYSFQKYQTTVSQSMHVWVWVQLLAILGLISYLFAQISVIGSPNMFYYGAFIFLSIYALTELMDKNPFALFWELLKNLLAIYWIFNTGDWFGISQLMGSVWVNVILVYLAISTVVTSYFVFTEIKTEKGFSKWSF